MAKDISDVKSFSKLLEQFEDLGGLPGDIPGTWVVKPFRAWKMSPWQHHKFTLRLLNSGEVLGIQEYLSDLPETTHVQAAKLEYLIRAIYSINGDALASAEAVADYNRTHNTNLTKLEYLRVWSRNVEQVVLDHIDSTISALQLKQIRLLQGLNQCAVCGSLFNDPDIPEGSKKLQFSTSELICSTCLTVVDEPDWDFEITTTTEQSPQDESIEHPLEEESLTYDVDVYHCACKQKFKDYEDYVQHQKTCKDANNISIT